VQSGEADRGPAHPHRFEGPERRHAPRPTDVDADVEQLGGDLLRRVLEGDRPAWRPRGGAQPALERHLVDLDHDAVDLVLDGVPLLAVPLDVLLNLIEARVDPEAVAHRQPPTAHRVVRRRQPLRVVALDPPDAVHEEAQRAGGGHPRVLLPQRAGRGVAGIRERCPARLDQLGVELLEAGDREEHLAAHLEEVRQAGAPQPAGDVGERAQIGRDVLAGAAVAAGRAAHQPAVVVEQRHREAVDLELAEVRRVVGADLALHPGRPGAQPFEGERVVQTHHPLEVLDRGEQRGDAPGDLLRG
jgi:hypothetical protein